MALHLTALGSSFSALQITAGSIFACYLEMDGVLKNENLMEGGWPRQKYSSFGTRRTILCRSKCAVRIDRLGEVGPELRRPEADFLRGGIYELRVSYQGVNYRMLYFFAGKAVVVVSHGLTKEREVPAPDIERALARKQMVEADFEKFTFRPE